MLWIGSVCIETKCFDRDIGAGPDKVLQVVALNKKIFKKEMCHQFMKVKCMGPPKCKYDEVMYVEIADGCTSDELLQDEDICLHKYVWDTLADTTNNPTRMIVDIEGPFKGNMWFVV